MSLFHKSKKSKNQELLLFDEQQNNGSTLTYQGSSNPEVDIISFYKQKISRSIDLKRRGINFICFIFLISLVSIIIGIIITNLIIPTTDTFTFKNSYLVGVNNFQNLNGSLMAYGDVVCYRQLFKNYTSPNEDLMTYLKNSFANEEEKIVFYNMDIYNSFFTYINLNPSLYLIESTYFQTFMINNLDIYIQSESPIQITFLNFMKLSVSIFDVTDPNILDNFLSQSIYSNFINIIKSYLSLEENLLLEIQVSKSYLVSILLNISIAMLINKMHGLHRCQRANIRVHSKYPEDGRVDPVPVLQNSVRPYQKLQKIL